ncbi:MAG: triose-phosphate isomerase [Acidobacteriota bacterium]|jgi:triosephosphate isomerase
MRKPIIAGNWKMFKLVGDSIAMVTALKPLVANANQVEIVLAPPYTSIKSVADRAEGSNIHLAAQDISTEIKHGAHTGEICGDMLKDIGCSHVIIGHSERRSMYGDTNQVVNRKIRAALNFSLAPIVCVGETLDERDAGREQEVVGNQLDESLSGLTKEEMLRSIIAYEPVWAIGTGRTASPVQAQEMHRFIRHWLSGRFDNETAEATRILYGGSVKPDNVADLMREPDIDGALVGGASLEAESFAKLVNFDR